MPGRRELRGPLELQETRVYKVLGGLGRVVGEFDSDEHGENTQDDGKSYF
jgi:hypothetical protein